MTEAYPLRWPTHWPRTPASKRLSSRFAPGALADEAKLIRWQVERLGGRYPVISTNIALRRDGLPYSNQRKPDDPGVAVYFELAGRQQCIPCDRWRTVEENARAIWKSIEAMRGLERWGAKSFVEAAFAGFKALPGASDEQPWWQVLEVPRTAGAETIYAAYRAQAKRAHPDAGGNDSWMAAVNRAFDQAMCEAGQR